MSNANAVNFTDAEIQERQAMLRSMGLKWPPRDASSIARSSSARPQRSDARKPLGLSIAPGDDKPEERDEAVYEMTAARSSQLIADRGKSSDGNRGAILSDVDIIAEIVVARAIQRERAAIQRGFNAVSEIIGEEDARLYDEVGAAFDQARERTAAVESQVRALEASLAELRGEIRGAANERARAASTKPARARAKA
jgi:hypothetical protein